MAGIAIEVVIDLHNMLFKIKTIRLRYTDKMMAGKFMWDQMAVRMFLKVISITQVFTRLALIVDGE
jgi:hypothetical protein